MIVNWNGEAYLEACLQSLAQQTFTQFETIVVDNGSTDSSRAILKRHTELLTLLTLERNLGYCQGNNLGCSKARGNYLFLLNADTRLEPDAVERLVIHARSSPPSWIGLVPKVVFDRAPFFINSLGVHWHHLGHWRDIRVGRMDLGEFAEGEQVFGAIFPAVFFHAQRFREIGQFDKRFFSYCEDFDVCYRANIMGYKFYTTPKAVVLHAYRSSIRSEASQRWHTYLFTRNYLMVFLKNYEAKSLLRYGKQILRRYAAAPVKRAYRAGGLRAAWPYCKACLWLVSRLPVILKQRLPLQYHRRVPDQALWNFARVEEANIFHYENSPVMSLLALRTAINEHQEYRIGQTTLTTV